MKNFAASFRPISNLTSKMAAKVAVLMLMSVGASAGTFTVTAPSAGETYTRGTNMNISWTYDETPESQTIYFSSNGGTTWNSIASMGGGTTSYTWNIPATQTTSTNYYIKISGYTSTQTEYCIEYECLQYDYYYGNCIYYNYGNCINYGYTTEYTYFTDGSAGAFTINSTCSTPVINTNPQSATVCANTSHTFTVASTMTDGTYQWKKDGAVVATTTVPSYTITSVATANAGAYTVTLTDDCSPLKTATSTSATLTVNAAPAITQQPQPTVVICQSGSATLTARASGLGKTFQWQKDGVNIPNAKDSNYVVANAQLASEGSYTVVVTGTCAPPATSNASAVSVVVLPVITTGPPNLILCPGSSGQLSVVATGRNLTYQWYRNSIAIGATTATLAFTNYAYAQDGQYYVEARTNVSNPNSCVAVTASATVTVVGYRPPSVVTQPVAVENCIGKSVLLQSEFQGFNLSYVWTRNGTAIPNSGSSASFWIPILTAEHAGDYRVTATGICNLSTPSNIVRVNVILKPTFSIQPEGKDLNIGQPLTLTVAASDPSGIQWFKDNKALVGKTATTLTIANVSLADAGIYVAIDSNTCFSTSSASARVAVIDPTSLQPRLTMTPESADLGEILVGYDATRTFTNLIQNTGTADMQVTDVSIAGTGFAVADATATPFTLAPGASSTVSVRATAENLNTMSGVLTVTTNAPPAGVLNLVATPILRYNVPADVNYGSVDASSTKDSCIQIVNNSTTNITLEQATISGPNAAMFSVVTPTPIAIGAGATGGICVKFAPPAVGSSFSAQLTLTSSTGGNTTMSLSGALKGAVGVYDLDARSGVAVYPNPARDDVSIRTANPATITIVNALGVSVASLSTTSDRLVTSWNTRTFNGTSVAAGTYSVHIRGLQGTVTVPLVIVR